MSPRHGRQAQRATRQPQEVQGIGYLGIRQHFVPRILPVVHHRPPSRYRAIQYRLSDNLYHTIRHVSLYFADRKLTSSLRAAFYRPLTRPGAMTSKRSQIAKTVREHILAGNLRPGARLTEKALCELTQASRSSVREALQMLEQEGYVSNQPNRGVRVAVLDVQEAADIYQVRSVLEGLAARNFINMATPAQREKLDQTLSQLAVSVEEKDVAEQLEAIELFYEALLEGCYNRVLKSSLEALHGKISRLRATSILSPGRIKNTLQEMARIGAAIRNNDEEEAWLACVEHMRQTSAVAIRVISHLKERG
ncbi:GntR family transcriptional regulator [Pollutimonas nitritireducens]|uniref:GntR family transcriptional regulator n=2 Tax=Pollutimonas nitritireducens TaxID=2045209 RepID=A0A2N4UKG7_9BURK|nr:GntR family transcriptional regulator [Pollutimonas nitritireducens]